MSDEMDVLRRDFLPEDLWREQSPLDFDGSIAVQARQSTQETNWLLGLANLEPRIKGVVGWVDLCSRDIEVQLMQIANHPKLVGVRHVVHDEPDDNFMLRGNFLSGISKLQQHSLAYDLLLFEKHLPVAIEVVEQFPEQVFVVDRISKPLIKDKVTSPWDENLRTLAAFPNVSCKLSGMVTEADWASWKPEDLTPYLDTVLEAFGPNRLMIGSDWPVCTVAGDYSSVMQATIDYINMLSKHEKAAILGETCISIYGLS